ncbi:MAG TPA: HAMP domain-containing sensor histidine kinase [Candidatus Eremiobacteraceae bacterium]|nr:HAMP domain-containing sensor histidine kinase [Candidatus Eremiobacteraceae bacterium]
MKEATSPVADVQRVRLRLTLAYAGILALLQIAFSVVVYLLISLVVWQDVQPISDWPGMPEVARAMMFKDAMFLLVANIVGLALVAGAAFLLAKTALRPLEQAIALQRQFTNDASHDLRTPLAVIRTETSAALHNAGLSAEASERLRIIDEQAQRMERLIDQLLTLSHVDADSALEREPTDLVVVVNGVVRDLQPLAQARSIELSVKRSESALVMGDELKLSQLVANLVDNAIKYSPERTSVEVGVWQARDAAFVAVADRGAGIPAEEHERIFLRFHRLDQARNGAGTGPAGHGLGLPLCRWIARAHGGDIAVDSREGKGSIFTVRLPALDS